MVRVALVGNIASGKSSAKNIIKQLGLKIIDTDKICHDLLFELKEQVFEAFSGYDIADGDEISREKLGQVVFDDMELKSKLEDILYPNVVNKIKEFFEENKNELAFVEIPLLYEAKMEDLFDKVIFIYCEDEIRLQRLMSRNNYTPEYARKRLECQMKQEEKISKADYVINNNKSIEDLEVEIKHLIEQIRLKMSQ